MKETIILLIVGWVGFWVWLWFARPDTFRKLHGELHDAFDSATGKAADAVRKEVMGRKRPPGGAA